MPEIKRLKLYENLKAAVLSGQKASTWRLFDDKNLSIGDTVEFISTQTKQPICLVEITHAIEKPLGTLNVEDKKGHEPFANDEEMYHAYNGYYNRPVDGNTIVKMIQFRVLEKYQSANPPKERPLSIVVAGVIGNEKILLLQRKKGDYIGMWSLPGGKIEKGEHVGEAAVREVMEETGIPCTFQQHAGIVSEHLVENEKVEQHFLLHVCQLTPTTAEIVVGNEGDVQWFPLQTIAGMKEKIIPSDYLMIEKLLLHPQQGKNYYECVIEKNNDIHTLKKFE
mgnify:CR=1 FL=1